MGKMKIGDWVVSSLFGLIVLLSFPHGLIWLIPLAIYITCRHATWSRSIKWTSSILGFAAFLSLLYATGSAPMDIALLTVMVVAPAGYVALIQTGWSAAKKWTLGVSVTILVVGVGAMFVYRAWHEASTEVDATLTTFMQAVASDDRDVAYALLSSNTVRDMSREDFEQVVSNLKRTLVGFSGVSQSGFRLNWASEGSTTYQFRGTASFEDGRHAAVSAFLIKEDGQWRIQDISVRPE